MANTGVFRCSRWSKGPVALFRAGCGRASISSAEAGAAGTLFPLPAAAFATQVVQPLALRADGEALGITGRDPHFAAQCDDRGSDDERLGQLVLLDVVREAFVVALVQAKIGPLLLDRLHSGSPPHALHDALTDASPSRGDLRARPTGTLLLAAERNRVYWVRWNRLCDSDYRPSTVR